MGVVRGMDLSTSKNQKGNRSLFNLDSYIRGGGVECRLTSERLSNRRASIVK